MLPLKNKINNKFITLFLLILIQSNILAYPVRSTNHNETINKVNQDSSTTLLLNKSDSTEEKFFNKPNLSKLDVYSSNELEQMWLSREYTDSAKLHNLLNNYDIQQPSKEFQLNHKFRVASLNIERGYKLNKLKASLKKDPVFDKILQYFPEITETETYKEAIQSICDKARKQNIQCKTKIAEFDNLLLQLLEPQKSQFTTIFPIKQLQSNRRKNKQNIQAGIYELAKQIHHLSSADVIALQEVDWGMPRTDYVHVVKELAEANGYGYVYGTEFLEFFDDGTAYSKIEELKEEKFKGLHGNAILSKWPLSNIRILRFAESFTKDPSMQTLSNRRCYDWWHEELAQTGPFEKLAYGVIKTVFDEDSVVPSVRLGSRMALIADVQTPEGKVTVVSTHLENRGHPKCRRLEIAELVNHLKSVQNPLVIAGDLNTTNEEARRPYFRHTLYWYIINQFELSTLVTSIATRAGLILLDLPIPNPIPTVVQIINQSREWRNPPGLGTRERKLFRRVIHNFSFDDGTVFDTRGSKEFNQKNSKRLLSNSNQTTPIGYRPTFCFARSYKKIFCMKLDWIFVKGNLSYCGRKKKNCRYANNSWAPTNPRTLFASSLLGTLSNHAAITTDLILPSLAREIKPLSNEYIVDN
ncbi:MAG: endonuclease/exonuclease/phosphatase family protein [Candidatus Caenarcaniphilales bacterium]|nr:endonuclease/exonuclease/phosphatase family protein [Candidatus Caenarcaniphilales bacterium]